MSQSHSTGGLGENAVTNNADSMVVPILLALNEQPNPRPVITARALVLQDALGGRKSILDAQKAVCESHQLTLQAHQSGNFEEQMAFQNLYLPSITGSGPEIQDYLVQAVLEARQLAVEAQHMLVQAHEIIAKTHQGAKHEQHPMTRESASSSGNESSNQLSPHQSSLLKEFGVDERPPSKKLKREKPAKPKVAIPIINIEPPSDNEKTPAEAPNVCYLWCKGCNDKRNKAKQPQPGHVCYLWCKECCEGRKNAVRDRP